ncbi:hypothetical protein CLIB1423_05S06414 [[Candida] railenensis]|uniref:Uncharacterized protein n=1 Tax=[Candida] railenensis TaxID=45579 RepID=A0A9P0QP54_9ASCO|nr:hypothetical protein CLIB1423_05S06414 [[Candida] railenensis]
MSKVKMSINNFFKTVSFRIIKYFVITIALVWYFIARPNRFSPASSKFQFMSRHFKRIVECSETGDGLECFKTYRAGLEKELEQEFSPCISQAARR